MTVGELIEQLKIYPQELEILHLQYDRQYGEHQTYRIDGMDYEMIGTETCVIIK